MTKASSLRRTKLRQPGKPYRLPQNSHVQIWRVDRYSRFAYLVFEGPIEASDVGAFQETVDYISPQVDTIDLDLNSDGGDLQAAMAIGRIVRKNWIWTTGPDVPGMRCLSACVFIFAAGAQRIAARDSVVGVHRPIFERYGDMELLEAQTQYARLVKESRDYLREMGITDGLADAMFAVSSDTLRPLSYETMRAMNLTGVDPAYEEWIRAREEQRLGRESTEDREAQEHEFVHRCVVQKGRPYAPAIVDCAAEFETMYPLPNH